MNYLSIYNSLINRALRETRYKRNISHPKYIYYEKHHINPKCLGGTDDKSNLVLLTGREHFLAHQLLVKIYPDEYKLVFALRSLCGRKNKYHSRNNKEYEWIKKLHAEKMSLMQKGKPGKGHKFSKGHTLTIGEKNGMYGKNHSQEIKNLQSIKAIERGSEHLKNIPKSEDYKQNMRKIKQTKRYTLVSPEEKEYTFDRISDAGKFCGISNSVLTKLAGKRYGFDNCRNWKIFAESL